LVDISEFIFLGENTVKIQQENRDFSDYVLVLHVHNPTIQQLQEVVENRRKEMEWKDWLVEMTRPLKISASKHTLVPNDPS
jgi:hypothetical protein